MSSDLGDTVPGVTLSTDNSSCTATTDADPGGGGLQSLSGNTQFGSGFMYILFGMAVLTMCFNLMQEKVVQGVISLGKKLGIVSDE